MDIDPKLNWEAQGEYGAREEALVGDFYAGFGVRFSLEYRPSCYRRGPYCLLVEVAHGPDHIKWGCFDDADQPHRYYHKKANAIDEAQSIADVLVRDRIKYP